MTDKKRKSVRESVMLVTFSIHQWYPKKQDRKATAQLANLHNIDPERLGSVYKNLINLDTIKPLQQRCRKLRLDVQAFTAPWSHGGTLALPADCYLDFTEMLREGIQEIDRLADKFAVDYEKERELAKEQLNGLFDENDYPPVHHVRNRFSIDYSFEPVPRTEDVRVWGLTEKDAKEMEANLKHDIEAKLAQAQQHVVTQVIEMAEEFIAKVQNYHDKVQKDEPTKLYDTAIQNLRDVIDLVLNGLNFSGDQELAKAAREIKKALSKTNVDKLKHSASEREEKIAAVEKALDKFSGVFG